MISLQVFIYSTQSVGAGIDWITYEHDSETVLCMEAVLSFAWEGGRKCVCVHVVRVCDAD